MGQPLEAEDLFEILADEDESAERWSWALAGIALPTNAGSPGEMIFAVMRGELLVRHDGFEPISDPSRASFTLQGEHLRARSGPSVSDLAATRIQELMADEEAEASELVCSMIRDLARWELAPAAALARDHMPSLAAKWGELGASVDSLRLATCIAYYTQIRLDSGEREAAGAYAAWAVTTSPETADYEALLPLWLYPDEPRFERVARYLFGRSDSSWLPLLLPTATTPHPASHPTGLFQTPAVDLPIVRERLVHELGFDEVVAEYEILDRHWIGVRAPTLDRGRSLEWGRWSRLDTEGPRRGKRGEVRYCDELVYQLSRAFGAIDFELYWPLASRDATRFEWDARLREPTPLFDPQSHCTWPWDLGCMVPRTTSEPDAD